MKPSESHLDDASVLVITPDGIIADAAENICSPLGWRREELVHKSVGDLFEYGADLVMGRVQEMQADANAESHFSVSALVRRSDQTSFPATAIVRRLAELDCFTIAFEDLPSEDDSAAVATEVVPAVESLDVAESNPAFAATLAEPETPEVESAHTNGNSNGHTTGFRNIFLSGSKRPGAKAEPELEPEAPQPKREPAPAVKISSAVANNGASDGPQLETERQERRRLEARVLSLNDQLQQLHAQLKGTLESESIYQKRVLESEEAVRKAEQIRETSEAQFAEEQKRRKSVEAELTQAKSALERIEQDRQAWQEEWLSKLASSLTSLKESDARLAQEVQKRHEIQKTLRDLHKDFCTQTDRQQLKTSESVEQEAAAAVAG